MVQRPDHPVLRFGLYLAAASVSLIAAGAVR